MASGSYIARAAYGPTAYKMFFGGETSNVEIFQDMVKVEEEGVAVRVSKGEDLRQELAYGNDRSVRK